MPRPDGGLSSDSPAPALGQPVAARLRIVLVEDDRHIAEYFRALMSLGGYDLATAETGPDGLRAIETGRPDVALIDFRIPGFDGCEVARRVRAAAICPQPYLVALTGFDGADDRRRAAEAGFDLFLVKPCSMQELMGLLDQRQRLLDQPARPNQPR